MHKIRLRKPWTKEANTDVVNTDVINTGGVGTGAVNTGITTRVDVPEPITEATTHSPLRYRRSFNRPSGLDDRSRVFLAIESWRGNLTSIQIDDQTIVGPGGMDSEPPFLVCFPIRVEITGILKAHNTLVIRLESKHDQAPLLDGEVRLEIESGELDSLPSTKTSQ